LLRVPPVYPKLALQSRVGGIVDLEAVIDEEGNVTDVQVIKGHMLLQKAAMDAVRQWKYTPTVQNGEPIKVIAKIQVIFKIE
jgi:protein TonB